METLRGRVLALAAWLLLVAGSAASQTLTNPDLSAIGDMRAVARDSHTADSLGVNQLEFQFSELEIALNAYLNPYMRADVFLGLADEGEGFQIDIEEANFTVLRGLPLALQFNAGIFLLDFGKINTQHAHMWAWIERPLAGKLMLGDEGLHATGVRGSTLIGVGECAVTLSASAFSSDAFAPEGGADAPAPAEIMGSGRASAFRQFGEAWSAELGASVLGGTYDPGNDLSLMMGDVDWKLKWRPNSRQAFIWVAEVMTGRRDVMDGNATADTISRVDATGAFTSMEMQWRKRWSGGGFFDWSEDPLVEDVEATAYGAFLGFSPVEETARIGLVYRHETSDLLAYDDNSVTLQFLWSLGPHKAHSF